MLETLISSRIRRTLFEYLLAHPTDRFYLRGLAKDLTLSVSPLRRELKRLEHSGMLRAVQEGNMLFYAVDTNSPAFLELARMTLTVTEAPSEARLEAVGSRLQAVSPSLQPSAFSLQHSIWQNPLSTPVLLGVSGVGMALLLVIGALFSLNLTHRPTISKQVEVSVVVPRTSSSGVMRGARWQVVPGGFGGFSNGANK